MSSESEGIPIYDKKYYLVGRKLIVIARTISKPKVIPGSSRHRTQMAIASGKEDYARCYIDIPARIK